MTTGTAVGGVVAIMAAAGLAYSPESAVIMNSGSTNRAGFQIIVQTSGQAEYTESTRRHPPEDGETGRKPESRPLSPELLKRFYSDLKKAEPLGMLPVQRCFKSVSFGTRLTIEFGGEQTPDLSCPGQADVNAQNLQRDANEIVRRFRKEVNRVRKN